MALKAFYYSCLNNCGDMLTPPIIEWLTGTLPKQVGKNAKGKLVAVGSIIDVVKKNDIVWGSGALYDKQVVFPSGVRFLAVRGPLTKERIVGAEVPEIYGDPGLLMPLIYQPQETVKEFNIGYIPHYVDSLSVKAGIDECVIDILSDWKMVIDQIVKCKKIVSSSLHGIILAEAYGIPAVWAIYSDAVIRDVKFDDYFLGTGRAIQKPFSDIPPITNLEEIQERLIEAFRDYYCNSSMRRPVLYKAMMHFWQKQKYYLLGDLRKMDSADVHVQQLCVAASQQKILKKKK